MWKMTSWCARKLAKGSMRLVDITESARLYNRIGQATRMSGGSAGNTAAAVASYGGRAAYIGKVSDDETGRAYAHDMRGIGVFFDVAPLPRIAGYPHRNFHHLW
jgi:sugar/nucleoside kinase (ribokinase family)